jgi:adenylate cyclase class 2
LGGACLQIDHWPLIPPYLEIEAHYREEVMRNAGRFDERELTGENTIKIYARYGMDLNTIRERFGEEAEVVWISAIGGVLRPKT